MAHLYLILLREMAKKNNFIFIKSWDSRNMEICGGKKINPLPILKSGRSDDLMVIDLSAWLCSQAK